MERKNEKGEVYTTAIQRKCKKLENGVFELRSEKELMNESKKEMLSNTVKERTEMFKRCH